jgi:hypothetical protein
MEKAVNSNPMDQKRASQIASRKKKLNKVGTKTFPRIFSEFSKDWKKLRMESNGTFRNTVIVWVRLMPMVAVGKTVKGRQVFSELEFSMKFPRFHCGRRRSNVSFLVPTN